MKVIITGGPSSEPIDDVRVITNRSTGELGLVLAQSFRQRGHTVQLFLGRLSQFKSAEATYFDRNEDLERMLQETGNSQSVDVVLHAAALSDFQVAAIRAADRPIAPGKIGSEHQQLLIELTPKPKVISQLRDFFPRALIVGWKLEPEATQDDLIRKAATQIQKNQTDACVINGRTFGTGFGFCTTEGLVQSLPSKVELAEFLADWVGQGRGCER